MREGLYVSPIIGLQTDDASDIPIGITTRNLPLKLLLTIFCTAFFCIPYFYLQRFPLLAVGRLPLFRIDRSIPFMPSWVWAYQSAYLLIFIVPWLLDSRSDLFLWLKGYLILCSLSFVILAVAPVDCPRPPDAPNTGMFGILLSYDGTINGLPSLHAGLSFYSALFAKRLPWAQRYLNINSHYFFALICSLSIWIALILFATIATKQHYAIDLVPGLVIAFLSYRMVTLNRREQEET